MCDRCADVEKSILRVESYKLQELALEETVMRFEQISNSTMSVLHKQIMDAEHLHMARLAYELRAMMPARSGSTVSIPAAKRRRWSNGSTH